MKTIIRLLRFLKPAAGQVMLSILAGLATVGAGIGLLGTSAYLIAAAALHPSIAELQVAIVGVRFFGISRGVFRYIERLISHSVNLKLLSELRVWFYQKVEPLAPAGLQEYSSGDLLQRSISDIETLENFYVRVVSPVIVALIAGTGVSWFIGITFTPLSWILAGGLVVNGLILPGLLFLLNKKNSRRLVETRALYSSSVVEYLQGLGELLAFNAEEESRSRLLVEADQFNTHQLKNSTMQGVGTGLTLLFSQLTLLSCLCVLITQVNLENISGISLAVIAMIVLASFEMVTPLPQAAQQLGSSIEAAERLFAITEIRRNHIPEDNGEIPSSTPNELRVDNLHFSYPGRGITVLSSISLDIKPGKKVGLVGSSGAGKSSLINLLMRYWEYSIGSIRFDIGDIKQFSPEYVRAQFGVVAQNTMIFNTSLRENLQLAAPSATDNELIDVLEKASLESWFQNLPGGLNTRLGENGVLMSGGEKQRLAIAQVLLRNPPFILLDEPTANLDPVTARHLLRELLALFSDKGILVISHDLLSMKTMDEICVLDEGRVIERGSYDLLVRAGGRFAHLAAMQRDTIG